MNTKYLEEYYNKFCEDKRLDSRHGQVEFRTTIKYIHKYLNNDKTLKIFDDGAGTGKYSHYFSNLGYDVTAIELIKNNLGVLKAKKSGVRAFLGNALDLSRFDDESYDIVLIFGPMYHLFSNEDRIKVLQEAKRITKKGGYIFISYLMNEYAIIRHGFMDNNIMKAKKDFKIDDTYKVINHEEDLYDYVRLEDIDLIKDKCQLERVQIVAQDGPTDYMRSVINRMDQETFEEYINYHLSICERLELIGASSHVLDILTK